MIPIDNDSSDPELDSDHMVNMNLQAPCCCPTINYHDLVNQYVQVSLLKEGKSKSSSRKKEKVDLGKQNSWEKVDWQVLSENITENLNNVCDEQTINHISNRLRQAKTLRNGLISMTQARAAEPLIGEEVEAIISGVQIYGFFAEIQPFKAEGLVHVSSLNDDWYEYRSRQSRLVGRKNKKMYRLGDSVIVKIIKVDILRNQIDLEVKNHVNQENEVDNRIDESEQATLEKV